MFAFGLVSQSRVPVGDLLYDLGCGRFPVTFVLHEEGPPDEVRWIKDRQWFCLTALPIW